MAANIGCVFNSLKITEQRQRLVDNPIPIRKLFFYRKEESQLAAWRDALKTDEIFWEIINLPPSGEDNKFIIDYNLRKPARRTSGVISVDGYSNEQGGRRYGSKACGLIYTKYDLSNPINTGLFNGWIYGRPSRKELLYDQLILASEFFGYETFFEHCADDYLSYFRQRGRVGYLGRYPLSSIDPLKREKQERYYGFPISPFAMTKQTDSMISYVEDFCHKIYWDKLLEQLLSFDPLHRTESDCVVSAMIGLVSSLDTAPKPLPKKNPLVTIYENEHYGKKEIYN